MVLLVLTSAIAGRAGLGTIFMPFGGRLRAGFGLLTLLLIVELGLMIAALPGLFARKMAGWRLLFYSQLVSIVFTAERYIVSGLLFGVISLYILFQVRPLYHEARIERV